MLRGQVVFELYEKTKQRDSGYFVRVLWGGQPMQTSTPLGVLDMVPVNNFFACKSFFLFSFRVASHSLTPKILTR